MYNSSDVTARGINIGNNDGPTNHESKPKSISEQEDECDIPDEGINVALRVLTIPSTPI